jgi:hypothetical protein
MRSFLLSSFGLCSVLAGCSAYDPDLGSIPYRCSATEPRCPENYACMNNGTEDVCITTTGPIVDGPPSGFQCADDSLLEGSAKNDTIANAYATPVAQQRNDISFAGVAICPEGDKDNYLIVTTVANSNIEVITSWDSGMPISVSILNAGGTSINNGTANGENSLRAYAANVPVGSYYANAYGAATTKNNYRIAITVSQ